MEYLRFIAGNWRLLGFGFVLSFASSFGQTFYIALSSAQIRAEFGLTHGEFGLLFTVATLASGVLLIWAGRLIDRIDLRVFTLLVVGPLILAMAALSVVSSLVALTIILFLLRFFGQGLLTHTASSTMARYFDRDRGKALGIALLGQPAGEGVLPLVAVGLIAAVGWRDSWLFGAAVMSVTCLVLLPWLLRGQASRNRAFVARTTAKDAASGAALAGARQWTRGEVLRDSRFYVIAPVVLAVPFIGTGFLFHQVYIAETRGWPLELLASAFLVFAVLRVAASLGFGPVIDRFGATRLVTLPLVPLVVCLVAVMLSDSPIVSFVYLGALGVSIGLLLPLLGAVWAELYGAVHIGAIKALSTSIIVLGSATSPAIFGLLVDAGVSIERISALCLLYVVVAGAAVIVKFHYFSREIGGFP